MEGCARLIPENRIPAVISEEVLNAALEENGFSELDLKGSQFHTDLPRLILPADLRIQCLHGLHRLRAAEKHLQKSDQWWAIDLFSSELSKKAKQEVREQYSNAKKNSDGELYRNIRHYRRANDSAGERRWRARISRTKEVELNSVENRLSRPLDRLIPFCGLWEDFNLNLFWRVLTWRCWEEVERYLESIWRFWHMTAGGERRLESAVDRYTVEKLQGRNPRLSANDREEIRWLFANGTLFASVSGEKDRTNLLKAVLSAENSILSFKTFSEDVKYLEPIAVTMRKFLSPPLNISLESRARELHSNKNASFVQRGEGDFISCTTGQSDVSRLSYVQLCLFCFRQFLAFEEASNLSGKTERHKRKQRKSSNDIWTPLFVERLAGLARRLGFDSPTIQDAMQEDNQIEDIARSIYSHIFGESCEVDEKLFAEGVKQIWRSFRGPKISAFNSAPELSTDYGSLSDGSSSWQQISFPEYFYLPTLCKAEKQPPKRFITLFAARRELLFAFYGRDSFVTCHNPEGSPESDLAETSQDGSKSPPRAFSPHTMHIRKELNALDTHEETDLAITTLTASYSEDNLPDGSADDNYIGLTQDAFPSSSSSLSGEDYSPTSEYNKFQNASEQLRYYLQQSISTLDALTPEGRPQRQMVMSKHLSSSSSNKRKHTSPTSSDDIAANGRAEEQKKFRK